MPCDFDTVAKRLKLTEAKKPRWETLIRGVALGYRKQPTTTRWLVRFKDPNSTNPKQPYAIEAFGYPDDAVNISAGREVMDYDAAQDRAKAIAKAQTKADAAPAVVTVRTVVERYIAIRDQRDRDMGRVGKRSDANIRLTKHVLAHTIADERLRDVTAAKLAKWRDGLDGKFTTKRRLVNDFKAALNASALDARIIKEGLKLVAKNTAGATRAASRPIQVLTDEQFRAVMLASREIDLSDGWEGDLHRMIVALAATGMRFSQVARMSVGDAIEDDFSLLVPASLKGGDSAYEQQEPIKRLVAESDFRVLRQVGDNRPDDAPLLERWRSAQTGFDAEHGLTIWTKDSRGPWRSASELVRPWAKIRERAGLDSTIVPYALRHTSIVRMLKGRLPASHVANLHNTSETMLRKHYARYVSDALRDLERGILRGVAA